jgi:hypothetical protein
MIWYQREPTLEEMLSDSIIQAVMAADGVDPRELAASLREMGGGAHRRLHGWGPWSASRSQGGD